jgi:hypothetical protein
MYDAPARMPVPAALLLALFTTIVTPQPPEVSEKAARTPAQQKINSQLLYEIYRWRGEAAATGVPLEATGIRVDGRGRVLVDIRASQTAAVQKAITRNGGVELSASARDRSIVARVPLLKLETLAADPAVLFIEPAAEATTNRQPARR